MRKTTLALALSGLLGSLLTMELALAQQRPFAAQMQASRGKSTGYRPLTDRRTIARPTRVRSLPSAPPRGATLVRGRYWDPQLRWKTDRATRSVYAVHRGEVWFMDPSTGWATTIDRYGRVYTADPRYRAVYAMGTVGRWRGRIPYFFGFFAPDDGYYSLPRYRNFTTYYRNDRERWYDYDDAYDYWWERYDDHFTAPGFRWEISFSFFDDRAVRYDRHYQRDVYIDDRGGYLIEPPPYRGGTGFGVPGYGRSSAGVPNGGWGNRFGRPEDARLPVFNPDAGGYRAPPPQVATRIIAQQPPATVVNIAPAMTLNVAAVVANNTTINVAIPEERQIVAIERSLPAPPQPAALSSFADSAPLLVDTAVIEEPLPLIAADTSFDPKAGLSADELDGSIDESTPELEALVEASQEELDESEFEYVEPEVATEDSSDETADSGDEATDEIDAAEDEAAEEIEAAEDEAAEEIEAAEDEAAEEVEAAEDEAAEEIEAAEDEAAEEVETAEDEAAEEVETDEDEAAEEIEAAEDEAAEEIEAAEDEAAEEVETAEDEAADPSEALEEEVGDEPEPIDEEVTDEPEPVEEEIVDEPEPVEEEIAEEPEPVEEEIAEEPEPVEEEVTDEPEPVEEEIAEEPEPIEEEVADEPEPAQEEFSEEPEVLSG